MSTPATVICTYRLKEGAEDDFMKLIEKHWPALRGAGLATEDVPLVFRGSDRSGNTVITEIFTWVDGTESPAAAHQSPEIMAVWEPMGGLCEERLGRLSMEFDHVRPVEVEYTQA